MNPSDLIRLYTRNERLRSSWKLIPNKWAVKTSKNSCNIHFDSKYLIPWPFKSNLLFPNFTLVAMLLRETEQINFELLATFSDNRSLLLTDWLTDWLIDWLAGWLAGWPAGWLADWLTDWLTDKTLYCLFVSLYLSVVSKWSTTHRVRKPHRSKTSIIYMLSWNQCALQVCVYVHVCVCVCVCVCGCLFSYTYI